MAIFHLSVKTISRSAGRSATAAAAYRAGVEITDERTGEIHDYRRKAGVESAALFLPAGAPEWATDRAQLWNAAEQSEKRKNSTVAREFEVALPAELSADQRRELAHEFARELVKRHGLAVDVAIHAPGKDGDSKNHHAHILCTTRKLTAEGFAEKTRELDDRATGAAEVTHWREQWAALTNAALERAGHAERVDHRTLEAQGIDREAGIHLGPAASAIERRGEVSQKTEHHQERQQEAAGKVAAIAKAQSSLLAAVAALAAQRVAEAVEFSYREQITQKEKEDDRVRNAALAALAKSSRATDQHLRAAGEAGSATDRHLSAAGANIGRAVESARGRQHHFHLGKVVTALGRSIGRLVPAFARAIIQINLYLVQRQAAAERKRATRLVVETRSAKEVWAASPDNPINKKSLKPQTLVDVFLEAHKRLKVLNEADVEGMRLEAVEGRFGVFSRHDRMLGRVSVLCELPENKVMPKIGQKYDSFARIEPTPSPKAPEAPEQVIQPPPSRQGTLQNLPKPRLPGLPGLPDPRQLGKPGKGVGR